MGKAFSKEGSVTKFVEALPLGGLITAPIHKAAGNDEHAKKALQKVIEPVSKDGYITRFVEELGGGFFTAPFHEAAGNTEHAKAAREKAIQKLVELFQKAVSTAVVKKAAVGGGSINAASVAPVSRALAIASPESLIPIFTESELSNNHKDAALEAMNNHDYDKTAEILLEATEIKLTDMSHQLSAESGGTRCLRSVHGTYLRAYKHENKVDMAPAPAKEWEHWYVEDWKGKVVFKAIHSPGKFLRALPDGSVDLVLSHPKEWEQWLPFKNDDGSWSFLSFHGQWLSANVDGRVYTVQSNQAWEHFWLEWWH